MLTAGVPLAAGFSPPYSITGFREVWASCTGEEEKGKGQAKGLPKVVQEAEQRTAFELFSPEVFQLILSLFYVWFLAHRVFSLFVFFFFLPPLCILF